MRTYAEPLALVRLPTSHPHLFPRDAGHASRGFLHDD